MQRLMGRTYEEGLSPSQRVEGGAGLKEEIDKAHGLPRPDIWHSVLVGPTLSVEPAPAPRLAL